MTPSGHSWRTIKDLNATDIAVSPDRTIYIVGGAPRLGG